MPARRCLARPQISYECTRPHARPARAGFMSMSMNKNTYTPFWYLHSVLGPTHVLTTSIQCTSGAKVHLLFTIYKVSMFFACLFSTFIHFWLSPPRNLALVSVPKFCYQLAKADAMLVGLAPLECSSPMRQQWPREAIIHRWLTVVTLLPGWVWSMAAVMSRRHRNTPSSVLYHHHLHRPTANTTIVLSSLWFWTQDCWWLHPGL